MPVRNKVKVRPTYGLLLLVLCELLGKAANGPSAEVRNNPATDAMRLLSGNCLACHNEEKHKSGLILTSRKTLLRGGNTGPAAVSGKPDASLLLHVLQPDADPHMPPKKQLSTNQLDLVQRWIAGGLKWDDAAMREALRPREVKLGPLPNGYTPVLALALSPGGDRLAVGHGNRIVIYDVAATNRPVAAEVEAHRDVVRALAWSPDGRQLASGAYRELAVRDGTSLQPLWTSTNLTGRVTALKFTPHGGALVVAEGAAANSSWVRLFAPETGKLISEWTAHTDSVCDLAISSEGGLLATAGNDKLVKLWELVSQKEVGALEGHAGAVFGVAFNPNAGELVTVGADKQLKLWDVKTRAGVVTMGGRKHGLNAVAWSADGKVVVAADDDGRLYSFKDFKRHTGEQSSATATERQLGRWPEPLHTVAVNADASRVYAGGQDGIVYVVGSDGKLLAKLDGAAANQPQVDLANSPGSSTNVVETAGQVPPTSRRNRAPRSSNTRTKTLPLPAGEGRGEGEPISFASAISQPPSFIHDVLPLLAKNGCSAGSCHAKAEGQNGFKLSVFSYDPKADYAEIVKEARGRRVFPSAPEESLILLKPTLAVEHGGGQRFDNRSEPYRVLRDWIRGGMVYQHTNEPMLARIEVTPHEGSYRKGAMQPLRVEARYSDGSTRDVTRLADYVANEKEIAQVDERGVIRVGQLSGEGGIVVRFIGHVDTARITVPADRTLPAERYATLPRNNFVDELAYAQFQKLGLFPSDRCTDAEFLRRAYLDTIGVLPTPEVTREFLAAPSRATLIDQLLDRPEFADNWANKWADLLRPNPDRVGVKSVFTLDQWLRESFRANKPYDQFVRDFLLVEGTNHRDGPAVVYRDRREPPELSTMFSQLFLGVRMECAKCHHHPNEKWSQDDFYQFAAFFGTVKQKGAGLSPPISAGFETFYFAPGGTVKHPVTDEVMQPHPLGEAADAAVSNAVTNSSATADPRRALADWLTDPKNPFFAKAAVNRVWAVFFGRGFVEPVDDFRISNPASNEPLLNALADDFAKHGYDLKHLVRTILSSHLYQLSSAPNEYNLADTKNFSRSYRRRLPAEVLLDAVNDLTGVPDEFNGSPPGTRALQTWSYKVSSQFMDAFARPNPSSDPPCERDTRTSVVQSLHLMNSRALQSKLSNSEGRAKQLADSSRKPEEIVTELYLDAFSRFPNEDELKTATAAYTAEKATRQTATEDVLWALLNSAEFVFNH